MIARTLEGLPAVRRTLSAMYRRGVYLAKWRPGPAAILGDGVSATDVDARLQPQDALSSTFFGYYEKSPWSVSGDHLLYHRAIRGESQIRLVVSDGSVARELGRSLTWNWQQGAMLQWLPGTSSVVLYNDLIDGDLRTRLVDLSGVQVAEWDRPVQAISPTGESAVSLNYLRLSELRPEYGYRVSAANFSADTPESDDGLWAIDPKSGRSELVASLARLAAIDSDASMRGAKHKVNHALYSPGGSRIVFLHRWFAPDGRRSRLMVADVASWNVRAVHLSRVISHYYWLNEAELICWCRGTDGVDAYHRIDVVAGSVTRWQPESLSRWGDGHPSTADGGTTIFTDTYPDSRRFQRLLRIRVDEPQPTEIARFRAPWRFDGFTRCDLHPRVHPNGQLVCIDSAHSGTRRVYVVRLVR